ncbi:hypothetical protein A3H80_01115 [Candidatus Roizmanbacteria bacterium RIFCSPLOWO2_02_FULL_37_19]|uniref:Probable transcriptional regulatory protein A3C24_05235 n=1 Tax=Candidatus Roizmanbacteria bacterium RIFCSPHIGHO2_02_FULL_37_24 TaxID=1802037 RepID=A0A1F7GU05_9BACT|nr:MAG: hypothetical protein A2862_00680 [Candidatus Roizmanbacteria bacterium RIFCSPHIGHO2_01_FULL_38_41]OGK22537.1 MAG: hypothetical protein A3C24_05235 [Candidatus Roizmanbacteria bacterium RIFCSPHIGHO2_02_FULL_37_24]OGK33937.1 MAG: hypothetical protein A3E10_02020 [Candidatus Roizmanbacteria bacterium RIFCSPHIGHO2_12_FULL_37_23]OGK43645.1 MAG: hypothetical protein A2956_04045 [Candidatus Roizmanbacteria bacterium RIFCSPLOWO2_01_FULL_37_57]OGK54200.1 MAG: hypothetical protein A3H80_01115 [Ca
MSGHSKWSTIKRKKGIKDQQRSSVFSKMARLITTAVHEGGGVTDPENNFKLRLAIERAKSVNMPRDTIDRAIEKAGGGEGQQLKEILYEGFGPGGVALLISVITDNTNRTHADVKQALEKQGGKMGGHNAVAYLFQKCGVVVFNASSASEEKIFAFADKIGALDIEEESERYVIYVPFENIGKVKELSSDIQAQEIDVFYRPLTTVDPKGLQDKIETLIDRLEDLEEVHTVYTNVR